MKTPENLRTPDLKMEETKVVLKEAKVSVDGLQEDVEFTKLNERYKSLAKRSRTLQKRYEKVLGKPLYKVEPIPTSACIEGGIYVNDKEKGTKYTLYGYKGLHGGPDNFEYGYRPGTITNGPELGEFPKLLVFPGGGKREEYELNVSQYAEMLNKIEDVLNREEQQIKVLEKKKGGGVDDVIKKL